jgi:hypothetical protein
VAVRVGSVGHVEYMQGGESSTWSEFEDRPAAVKVRAVRASPSYAGGRIKIAVRCSNEWSDRKLAVIAAKSLERGKHAR